MKDFAQESYSSYFDGQTDWFRYHHAGNRQDCVVFLHGHGSDGNQLLTREDLRVNLPFLEQCNVNVLSPNLRGNAWMSVAAVADLRQLLKYGKTHFRWRRILFVSGSMGGAGALIFAMLHPDLADGLVVLGGVSDVGRYREWCRKQSLPIITEIGAALDRAYPSAADFAAHNVAAHAERLTMPIFWRHGSADRIMPVEEAHALLEGMRGRSTMDFAEIEDGDHDSPLIFFRQGLETIL